MKAMIVKYTYTYIISYYYIFYTYKDVNQIRCLIHEKKKEKKRHVMNEFSMHTLGGTTRLQMAKRYAEHSTKWKFSF